jgi:predicted HTH domain antitoxin
MPAAHVEISEDILDSARLTPEDVKQELALALYGQHRLSVGKARQLAGLSLWEFRQLSAMRGIAVHYDESELNEDLKSAEVWERSHA